MEKKFHISFNAQVPYGIFAKASDNNTKYPISTNIESNLKKSNFTGKQRDKQQQKYVFLLDLFLGQCRTVTCIWLLFRFLVTTF